jgi:hypothetical protein
MSAMNEIQNTILQHDYDNLVPIYQTLIQAVEDGQIIRDELVEKLRLECNSFFNKYPRKANRIKDSSAVNKRTVLVFSRENMFSKKRMDEYHNAINLYKIRVDICLATATVKGRPVKKMHLFYVDGIYYTRDFEHGRYGIESHHLAFLKELVGVVNTFNQAATRNYRILSEIRKSMEQLDAY